MTRLESPRLVLRSFTAADFDTYAEMTGDAETMRHVGDGKPLDRPNAWRNLAMIVGHWSLRGYGIWALERKEDGALVGRAGFWNPEGWPGFELGWLLHPQFRGQGYASEAGAACLDEAFGPLAQREVLSVIRVGNDPSVRVARRLGESFVDEREVLGVRAEIYRIRQEEWAGAARFHAAEAARRRPGPGAPAPAPLPAPPPGP